MSFKPKGEKTRNLLFPFGDVDPI